MLAIQPKFLRSRMSSLPTELDLTSRVVYIGEQVIAIGEYSDVWAVVLDGESQKAIAKLIRGALSQDKMSKKKLKKRLNEFGLIWRQFDHRNVAKFFGFSYKHPLAPALILERYPLGNIVEYLRKQVLSIEDKVVLIKQVASGLQYLHDFDPCIVHGDIRSANILIASDNRAVLCDYSLAFIIIDSEFTSAKPGGNCRWTAPEVMSPPEILMDSSQRRALGADDDGPLLFFTKESDIFSFGMTMLEIFGEQRPFNDKIDSAVIFAIIEGRRPELPVDLQCYKTLCKLITKCWDQEPSSRPTITEVRSILESDTVEPASMEEPRSFLYRFSAYVWSWIPL